MKQTLYQQAMMAQLEGVDHQRFAADLTAYLNRGYVYSLPDIFVMAKTVPSDLIGNGVLESDDFFEPEESDTWYVHLMSGKLSHLFYLCPFQLEYVCFQRFGSVKLYRFQEIQQKLSWECEKLGNGRRP